MTLRLQVTAEPGVWACRAHGVLEMPLAREILWAFSQSCVCTWSSRPFPGHHSEDSEDWESPSLGGLP